MNAVHHQTKTQIDLDQRTGKFAIEIRANAEAMSNSYSRINKFRAAALAGCVVIVTCPMVIEFGDVYLKAEKAVQTAIRLFWAEQKAEWNLATSDIPQLTLKSAFPDFPFKIINGTMSDLLNTHSLRPPLESFTLSLRNGNLSSTAVVRYQPGGNHDWTLQWTE